MATDAGAGEHEGLLQAGGPSAEVKRAARIAGLRDFETPSLEQVERRRFELLGLTFGFLVALSAAVALLPGFFELPDWLSRFGATAAIVRGLLVCVALAFGIYVLEKERALGRVSKALVNERVLSAALSNRLKEISSLTEAGRAVLSILDLEEVLHVILNAAFDLLEADEGSVLLAEGDDLVVAAATGSAERYLGSRRPMSEGLAGYVARRREPLLIEGKPDLKEMGGSLPERETRISSAMSVPLEAKGELLGVLNLNVVDTQRQFNEYDLRALSLFGEHAAMAIRHARVLRKERDLRTQMVELDRIRAELVGSMTHDLKTPLTSIVGASKILLQRFDELDEARKHQLLDAIQRQAQRQLQLIDRMLDAARSHTAYPLAAGRLDLGQQVESLAQSFASAHDRSISMDKAAARIEAFADPDAVEQVVANLLENAVKHTPAGTPIHVRVTEESGYAVLVVRDEGPGVPVEERATLFEPFRRGREEKGSGVGLGLFIVANLVRSMGGTVEVSGEQGEGAVFTVRLPSEPPSQAPDALERAGGERQ